MHGVREIPLAWVNYSAGGLGFRECADNWASNERERAKNWELRSERSDAFVWRTHAGVDKKESWIKNGARWGACEYTLILFINTSEEGYVFFQLLFLFLFLKSLGTKKLPFFIVSCVRKALVVELNGF